MWSNILLLEERLLDQRIGQDRVTIQHRLIATDRCKRYRLTSDGTGGGGGGREKRKMEEGGVMGGSGWERKDWKGKQTRHKVWQEIAAQ